MNNLPEIKNPEYHDMSFEEVDKIREGIKSAKLRIKIRQTQLMLYLNQMSRKHSFILRIVQKHLNYFLHLHIGFYFYQLEIVTFVFYFGYNFWNSG